MLVSFLFLLTVLTAVQLIWLKEGIRGRALSPIPGAGGKMEPSSVTAEWVEATSPVRAAGVEAG